MKISGFFLHSLKNEISSIFSPIALSPSSSFQLLSRLQLYPHFQGLMVHTTCENDCNFSSVCFFGKILFASTVDVAFCTYQLHLFHKNSHLNDNTVTSTRFFHKKCFDVFGQRNTFYSFLIRFSSGDSFSSSFLSLALFLAEDPLESHWAMRFLDFSSDLLSFLIGSESMSTLRGKLSLLFLTLPTSLDTGCHVIWMRKKNFWVVL